MRKNLSEMKAPIDNLENWVDEYGDFLYRYALARVKDPSSAEDLVQETFLAARERIKKAVAEILP